MKLNFVSNVRMLWPIHKTDSFSSNFVKNKLFKWFSLLKLKFNLFYTFYYLFQLKIQKQSPLLKKCYKIYTNSTFLYIFSEFLIKITYYSKLKTKTAYIMNKRKKNKIIFKRDTARFSWKSKRTMLIVYGSQLDFLLFASNSFKK